MIIPSNSIYLITVVFFPKSHFRQQKDFSLNIEMDLVILKSSRSQDLVILKSSRSKYVTRNQKLHFEHKDSVWLLCLYVDTVVETPVIWLLPICTTSALPISCLTLNKSSSSVQFVLPYNLTLFSCCPTVRNTFHPALYLVDSYSSTPTL